ncbi:MAG TPA: NlpC/P60 family protein [Acidimicrobiales bacterium]|nr:NlpC/P60 family protein [Acidimicrobiales bacterium]
MPHALRNAPALRWRRLLVLAASFTTVLIYPAAASRTPAAADPGADLQAQANALAAQIQAENQQQDRLTEEYDLARIRADSLTPQVEAAKAQVAQNQTLVNAIQSRVREDAVNSFIDGGTNQSTDVLKDTSYDSLLRQQYIDVVAGDQHQIMSRLHQARQGLDAREHALEQDQQSAQAALASVAAAGRAAAAQEAAEQATLSHVKGELVGLVAQAQQQRQPPKAIAASAGSGGGPAPAPPPNGGASAAVYWAQQELGKPYQYGAAGPNSFDCSGLTMWAWEHAGVSLPHSSSGQYNATSRVSQANVQPGDLIFEDWGGGGPAPSHVGIYVGNGQMIDAPHSGANVEYDPAFRSAYYGAGRVR